MRRTSPATSRKRLAPTILAIVLLLVVLFRNTHFFGPAASNSKAGPAVGPGEYLLCVWNVENLFDDKADKRRPPDAEYDEWFADNQADRELKYRRLTEALLRLNGGKGPDIIALIEVETIRAAELMRDSLNKNLPAGTAPYGEVAMKEVVAGRHIAPAIISRLPVKSSEGFNQYRILESHIEAGGKELVVMASHWTSHRSDDGAGGKRDRYGKIVNEVCNKMFRADPKADILVCGDFNDEPNSPAVADALDTTGDAGRVSASRERILFLNLLAGKDPLKFGTHYYNKPVIYDHICLSPGLLDQEGWTCDPESIQVVTEGLIRPGATRRQPWRFGNRRDNANRGYSDHFPITVKLKVVSNPP
jgi:endonuclease/exonuclease/phosphatase family metal-dependent hydrolase